MDFKYGSAKERRFPSILSFALPGNLLGRLYLLAAIFALETILAADALRTIPLIHPRVVPIAIVSFAVYLGLGHTWLKAQRENIPFGLNFFAGYLACFAAAICIHPLLKLSGAGFDFPHAEAFAITTMFVLKIFLMALACVPYHIWIRMLRATIPAWLYATLAGVSASFMTHPSQTLWTASSGQAGRVMQYASFHLVQAALHSVLPDVTSNAAAFTIATPHYAIMVGPTCSGMEGLGLVLVFTSVWLWYSRKEIRLLRGLLLIPFTLACIWLLNIVRLCGLFFIGNSGSEEIANVGFHSQFGWIAFTTVALAFSLATQRLSWMQRVAPAPSSPSGSSPSGELDKALSASRHLSGHRGESPAIRAYLVPFLAILAATSVSKAASGYFEWLYPLRFIAAAIALWYFRPELKKLNWRFGWIAPLTGAAVFVMWIAPSWRAHSPAVSVLGPALAALSPTARWGWIAFRVAAAVVTVPIAEELAFRGYLARRLINWDFRSVAFTGLTVFSVALSSAVFGLEHMKNLLDWPHLLLGFLAGCAFALALRWRGRMGDAVAAHAISNLLLAVWVLASGDWAQW